MPSLREIMLNRAKEPAKVHPMDRAAQIHPLRRLGTISSAYPGAKPWLNEA